MRHILMIGHWSTVCSHMFRACSGRLSEVLVAEYPSIPLQVVRKTVSEYRLMAVCTILVTTLSIYYSTSIFIDIWLIPLLAAWAPAHALIELPEHWRCDNPSSAVTSNTRSLRAGRVAAYITNHNDCHAGHHFDGRVPMDKLDLLEAMLHEHIGIKHLEDSYPAFYSRFLAYLWSGRFAGCP